MHAGAVRELSMVHEPIGELFPKLDEATREQWKLSPEQIRFYEENGYVVGPQLLEDTALEHLRAELKDLMQPAHPGNELWHEYHSNESTDPNQVLFHALGAWRIAAGFHDLLWHPGIVVPAQQLLSGSVRFWHDQLFCKPAKHGGVVAWHQDYSYWTRTAPMAHLTAWIGLDESTPANGCVYYIPGSHRWDLLPITGLSGHMHAIQSVLNDQQWERFQQPVPVPLRSGQCVFHHPLTIHGSFANLTDVPRRATVINMIQDGVCSTTPDPLLKGVDPIPPGGQLLGQFHPLLSRA